MIGALHPPSSANGWERWLAWSWDPLALPTILIFTAIYAIGVTRLWRRAGVGHGVRRWQVACFSGAVAVLVLALLSPVDTYSDVLFSVHMVQHELLLLVAAPLWAMSSPLAAMTWALPAPARLHTRTFLNHRASDALWGFVSHPTVVVVLHGIALWIWHVPAFFEAALRSEAVHGLQHVAFFSTAVLFWWSLVHGRYGRLGYGVGVAFVFATATHGGVLGALFTFADQLWYPEYAARSAALGTNALEDQQLAGALMWVPAGILLTCLGLAFLAAWLGESARRADHWDALAREGAE